MHRRKTHEEYVLYVERVNPNIEVLECYIDSKTPILHKCKIDGHIWPAKPNNILSGKGCPECAKRKLSNARKKTHLQYTMDLKIAQPSIKVLGVYAGDNIKILHECLICGYKWDVTPSNLLHNRGCPVCGHHIIGPPPEYKNSIWTSEYKDFFSQFMTDEQMKTIMPHSGKNIVLPCPNCGKLKSVKPCNLVNYGFGCICGDGQSFPNKFMYNVLSQLHIKTETEYSPEWAGLLKYDDYLIDYNIIIENHGLQHYEECPLTRRTLKEEQENDMLKYNIAYSNGINGYIIIDCRRPSMEWIKKSIMQSYLPQILNFTESDINWVEALRYATHSLIKTAAEMFNKGMSITEIANNLQKNNSTIRNWLKIATKFDWCYYVPKQIEKIYCIEMDKVFESKNKAAKETHTSVASIINNLNGVYSYAGRHPQTKQPLHWKLIKNTLTVTV